MKNWFIVILSILFPQLLHAQDGTLKNKAYNVMLNNLLSHTVDEISIDSASRLENAVWLDARAFEEFSVSHIKNAKWVGYDNFQLENVEGVDFDDNVIVYCSVGYRSEKVAEKLRSAGFKNVKNLYGGIFEWINQDKLVYDSLNEKTSKVHAFDRMWGVWLEKGEKVY